MSSGGALLDEGEYSRWMRSAKRALESALGDAERGDFNWACFKAQQAAEFAAKALLHGIGAPACGHSVARLLGEVGVQVPSEIVQAAKTLDKYYVPTRYPNAWAEGIPNDYYTERDAEEAIKDAEAVIRFVEDAWKSLRGGRWRESA